MADVTPGSSIERTRVLGVRVETEEDPDVATPAPGRRARLRLRVVHPEAPRPLSWALALCPAADASGPRAACAGPPFAIGLQPDPIDAEPTVDFEVPDDAALGGARALLVGGVVCAASNPRLASDATAPGCTGPREDETLLTARIALEHEGQRNRNPSLDSLAVRLVEDDVPVPARADANELPVTACARVDALPVVRRTRARSTVRIDGLAGARERWTAEDGTARIERWTLSTFVDRGAELERQYSNVDDETAETLELRWPDSRVLDPNGSLVRLHLVVRDGRGGTSWSTHPFCLQP